MVFTLSLIKFHLMSLTAMQTVEKLKMKSEDISK